MKKCMSYLKPYTGFILLILLFTFIYALIYLSLPRYMGKMVDNGVITGNTKYILRTGAVMGGLTLIGALFSIIASFLSSRVACSFGRDIREKLFVKIEYFSINEFDHFGTDSLITRTTNDVLQVQQVLSAIFKTIVFAPILCLGGVIMIAVEGSNIQWILWVAISSLVLFCAVFLYHLLPIYEKIQRLIDQLNSTFRENLMGVRVIRAFNRTLFHRRKYEIVNKKLVDNDLKANRIDAAIVPMILLTMNGTTLAVLWFGGLEIARGQMQIGSMLAFIQYALQILASVIMVAFVFAQIPRAIISSRRINQVLLLEPEIVDSKEALLSKDSWGKVEFKNVFYKYKGADEFAVENISFQVNPGEITAIIGGTGSGKTTIFNLLARFYDVTQGSILVDGTDIRQMTQEALRDKLALVTQKSILFSGTITENIKYGKEDALREEVNRAADIAQAREFIEGLDKGYDARILKGGKNVSGGQRQRLAIARALIKKPQLYLFDDCFSALDYKTDKLLRAALKKEIAQKTVIIVSQRVSSILDADHIIVLDEGKIRGRGKHNELLQNCPVYREIVESQFSRESPC